MKQLFLLFMLIDPPLQEDRIVINKSYEIANPSEMTVIIDNLNGDVEVASYDGNTLSLALVIELSAQSETLLDQARRELKLGQLLGDDSILFFTKAPFVKRCDWKNGWSYTIRDHPGYTFKYQYKIQLPEEVMIEARTVNNGDVRITNMKGRVKACNVNGNVEIVNAVEVLQASTVNGDVSINFIKSPNRAVDFNTVNGDFNFELPDDFGAQVYFDTMHGELYTSFDYHVLSPKISKSEDNGKFRIGSTSGVEIGSGGPELSFRSINGNVYLKKRNN